MRERKKEGREGMLWNVFFFFVFNLFFKRSRIHMRVDVVFFFFKRDVVSIFKKTNVLCVSVFDCIVFKYCL